MKQQYKIAIIGSGNLGSHLAINLQQAGYRITQIFSQNISHAEQLACITGAEAIDNLLLLKANADIYFVCVKDDAIEKAASLIRLNDKIIAHTSASVSCEVLQQSSENYGVFYPLQSFSKDITIDFSTIPIFIEADNTRVKHILTEVAESLSNEVHEADGHKRLALHVAAIFANNFSNYLFTAAEDIMSKEGLSFRLLLPLINETVRKIQSHSPKDMQTGPASRNDTHTIQKHLDYLADEKKLRQLYELLSKNISQSKK